MLFADNEKQETTHDVRNKTTTARKNQNARRKGNLQIQIQGNIGSGHHQTRGDERKNKNEYIRRKKTSHRTKLLSRNLINGINTLTIPQLKYSGPFLKWRKEELK